MKKKCSPFSIITLLIALAGLTISILALLNRRCGALCEDVDDGDEDLVEYLDDDSAEIPESDPLE